MVKTKPIPAALPIEVFDGFRAGARRQPGAVLLDVASGPFYGFNRPGAEVSQGVIQNWWRQGMMGGAKAHYEGIKAFSETDQTEDLKTITSQHSSCTATTTRSFRSPNAELLGQAAQEQHAQGLSGLPTRDADRPMPM